MSKSNWGSRGKGDPPTNRDETRADPPTRPADPAEPARPSRPPKASWSSSGTTIPEAPATAREEATDPTPTQPLPPAPLPVAAEPARPPARPPTPRPAGSFNAVWTRSPRLASKATPPPPGVRPILSPSGEPLLAEGAAHAFTVHAADGDMASIVRTLDSVPVRVDGRELAVAVPHVFDPRRPVALEVGQLPAVSLTVEGGEATLSVQEDAPAHGPQVELHAEGVSLTLPPHRSRGGDALTLVDNVTFVAKPGDLVAVMGDSGAGKSSLFSLLSGYRRPTRGRVLLNGHDLHGGAGIGRGVIGLVPQDDLVHPELTVREAVRFSAKLRRPDDGAAAIEQRVERALTDLGLFEHADKLIGSPEKQGISGGQRKRVNIALELVADPAVLLLDEPTSGLAASDAAELIRLLDGLAKAQRKTILAVIHQPSKREYERFSRVLVLGHGGRKIFEGTPAESYAFFDDYRRRVEPDGEPVADPAAVFECLRKRSNEMEAALSQRASKVQAALAWQRAYEEVWSRSHPPPAPATAAGPLPPTPPPQPLAAFRALLARYATVKRRDHMGLAITALQPCIIGVILAAVFGGLKEAPVPWCLLTLQRLEAGLCLLPTARFNVADHSTAIFFLVLSAIWCGTSNAAREVVSERAIYRRESMAGLPRGAYLLSKFTLLTGVALAQCAVMLGFTAPALGLGNGEPAAVATMLLAMVATGVCATSLGLLTSAALSSEVAAMAATPILLIPQVILAGLIVRSTEKYWLADLMWGMPSHWGLRWMLNVERDAVRSRAGWLVETCAAPQAGVVGEGAARRWQCALQEFSGSAVGEGALGFGEVGTWWPSALWLLGAAAVFLVAARYALVRHERRWAAGG